MDVTQQKDEDFKFIAIAVELPEMFSLSRSKTIIKSNTEPGFSVDIPEDTFASDKKLRVDVSLSFSDNVQILNNIYIFF